MAVKYDEVELLGEGIQYAEPTKGNFVLNMLRRNGAWEVREGFGQLAEHDTLMCHNLGRDAGGSALDWGYKKHLGSYVIRTDFGHTQIVSAFKGLIYTDEASQPPIPIGTIETPKTYGAQVKTIFLVNIYDVTTGNRWEEPLYTHTSEGGVFNQTPSDMPFRHGNYESCLEEDMQSWVSATSDDAFFFAEVSDTLYFGSKSVPLYAYSPCVFKSSRHQQVATFRDSKHGRGGATGATVRPEWSRPYSESAIVWRVRPSVGDYSDVYSYRTASSLPHPEAMISFDGCLVIANERVLYFSDVFRPTVYIDSNIVVVPTEKNITALGRSGQNIYVFTESETWVYTPGSGRLLGDGAAPVRISDSIGCISQNAITNFGEALIWVGLRGVHVASGGFEITTISAPIEPFFTEFITDPCTTFFTATTAATGSTGFNPATPSRNSVLTFERPMVNVDYCDHLSALLITIPDQRIALCLTDDQWSVWTFESNTQEATTAYTTSPAVVRNIMDPWLLSLGDRLYCVGSVQTEIMTDNTAAGFAIDGSVASSSYYILEYGRGGAIDRSVDDEDERVVAGRYRIDWSNTTGVLGSDTARSVIVFDQWEKVQPEYKFWGVPTSPTTVPAGDNAPAAPEETYLVPVKLVPAHADYDLINGADRGIEKIEIKFFFDKTRWQPVFQDGTSSTNIDLVIPPERMSSKSSWTTFTCKDSSAGYAASRDGDYIELVWDGTAGGAWAGNGDSQPVAGTSGGMNVAIYRENILCYIPMETRNTGSYPTGMSTMGLRISGLSGNPFAKVYNNQGSPANHAFGAYIWQQWARWPRHREDSQGVSPTPIAQPVDWAYMSPDIALNSDTRVKLRGLAVTMLSHGQGTDTVNSWTQGVFNTMFAADLKTWMAQVVDYIGGAASFRRPVSIKTNLYPTPIDEETIRDRVPAATPGARAEFGAGVEWGNATTPGFETDTCLVGDEQVDTIVTSDSVKGTSVSAMVFGFMRNPAERLKIQSVKALIRVVGANRRRKGR